MQVGVSLSLNQHELNRVSIDFVVKDTGIGLSPAQQKKLFQPFSQADASATRRFGGTGLGLNLSKNLAQLLGGDMHLVFSEPGVGSEFRFSVDGGLASEMKFTHAALTVTPVEERAQPIKGMRILLIEDSKDNRTLFTLYLRRAGAEVDTANDGVEGVQRARLGLYDTILMDIQMPLLDGCGATQMLREEKNQTPIIALTAYAILEERERALASGFNDYLTKPVNPVVLIEKLSGFFLSKN